MAHSETNAAPAVGLDIGTSRLVLARGASAQDYDTASQLNAFVTIPYARLTENVLKKESVPHTVQGGHIVVHGSESERFADLLNVETRRPMTRGVLNPSEPDSLALMRQMIASLVGANSRLRDQQRLCFSIPAAPLGTDDNVTYHEATLREMLVDMGFEVKAVNEGLAVVYAELESTNYTGIGISCGGGLCNVCLAYLSVPVLSFSIDKAGDYIDQRAASVTGELANRVRLQKEDSFHLNGASPNKIHQVLGVHYDEMIQALVQGLKEAFLGARSMPKLGRPIPLVLSGGTAMPRGFRERFEKHLRAAEFPIPLAEIRMAENPMTTTAKGCLVAALAEL